MRTNVGRIQKKKVQKNNTSGHTGVCWHNKYKKWFARISFCGRMYNLGYFDKLEDAIRARQKAEEITFEQYLKSLQDKKTIFI